MYYSIPLEPQCHIRFINYI